MQQRQQEGSVASSISIAMGCRTMVPAKTMFLPEASHAPDFRWVREGDIDWVGVLGRLMFNE